jgi:hypothetical protein
MSMHKSMPDPVHDPMQGPGTEVTGGVPQGARHVPPARAASALRGMLAARGRGGESASVVISPFSTGDDASSVVALIGEHHRGAFAALLQPSTRAGGRRTTDNVSRSDFGYFSALPDDLP